MEAWFAARFAAALGAIAPSLPPTYPRASGVAVDGHKIPFLDQANDWHVDAVNYVSHNMMAQPAYIALEGVVTVGKAVGVRLAVDGLNLDFRYTPVTGDTLATVAAKLRDMILENAHCKAIPPEGMRPRTIGAEIMVATGFLLVTPHWKHIPVVSDISDPESGVTVTITQSNGQLDTGFYQGVCRYEPGYHPRDGDWIATPLVVTAGDSATDKPINQYLCTGVIVKDPTPGSLKAWVYWQTPRDCVMFGDGMWLATATEAPTGMGKGPGTLNAFGLFVHGQPVALQAALDALETRVADLETSS